MEDIGEEEEVNLGVMLVEVQEEMEDFKKNLHANSSIQKRDALKEINVIIIIQNLKITTRIITRVALVGEEGSIQIKTLLHNMEEEGEEEDHNFLKARASNIQEGLQLITLKIVVAGGLSSLINLVNLEQIVIKKTHAFSNTQIPKVMEGKLI